MSLLGCLAITEGYIVAYLLPLNYRKKVTLSMKLKLEFDQGITVNGKLIARGTADSPIVLTSVQDDGVCGIGAAGEPICDTNNNTTASVPATGDWKWIDFTSVSDPGSEISRAIIRYGGRDHCGNYCDHWL